MRRSNIWAGGVSHSRGTTVSPTSMNRLSAQGRELRSQYQALQKEHRCQSRRIDQLIRRVDNYLEYSNAKFIQMFKKFAPITDVGPIPVSDAHVCSDVPNDVVDELDDDDSPT